jgi:hypothetical protein
MVKLRTLNSMFTPIIKEEMQERTELEFIILKTKMKEEKTL